MRIERAPRASLAGTSRGCWRRGRRVPHRCCPTRPSSSSGAAPDFCPRLRHQAVRGETLSRSGRSSSSRSAPARRPACSGCRAGRWPTSASGSASSGGVPARASRVAARGGDAARGDDDPRGRRRGARPGRTGCGRRSGLRALALAENAACVSSRRGSATASDSSTGAASRHWVMGRRRSIASSASSASVRSRSGSPSSGSPSWRRRRGLRGPGAPDARGAPARRRNAAGPRVRNVQDGLTAGG